VVSACWGAEWRRIGAWGRCIAGEFDAATGLAKQGLEAEQRTEAVERGREPTTSQAAERTIRLLEQASASPAGS